MSNPSRLAIRTPEQYAAKTLINAFYAVNTNPLSETTTSLVTTVTNNPSFVDDGATHSN